MFDLQILQISTHLRAGPGQWMGEALATFGLVLIIIGTARQRPTSVPAAVALYITAAYWFTSSTSFANPAITVERANFPARMLVASPPQLDAASTAALWMAYLTAYGALVDIAGIGRGDVVAITAASSSVGIAAIQMANLLGAIPIALTRTAAKAPALRELGAHEVIKTEGPDVADRLQAAAGRLGVRVVLDAVGGPLIEEIAKAMSCHGQVFEYGGLSSEQTPFPLGQALGRQLLMRGYLVHHVTANPDRLARAEDFILSGVGSGVLRPVIDRIFPFDRVVDAHRWLESGNQIGKVVLQV